MHIIRNAINQIRSYNNDHFISSLLWVVKQRFSLKERCVTARFLANPQFKHSRDTSYVVTVSFTEKKCTLFTPPRNGALVCVTIGPDDTYAIMCRKGTDFVFDAPMLYACADAKWHYLSMLPYTSVTPGPNCAGKCSCFTLPAAVLSCIIVMQKILGGTNKVHYGRCTSGVIGHFFFLCPVTVLEVFAIVNSAQFNFLLVSDVALLQWHGHLLILPLLFGLGSGLGLQGCPFH